LAAAVKSRSLLKMIKAGGNVYYIAKLAGLGLNVQDIGAQQTGMTVEAFKSKLNQRGHDHGCHRRRRRHDARSLDGQSDYREEA
jgi:hypothetical protein